MEETIRTDWSNARRKLYAMCAELPYGELLTYAALSEALEVVDARAYRSLILRVAKALEQSAMRTLLCVRNEGYRIAYPKDHLDIGTQRQQRGRRQVERAVGVLRATSLVDLTPEERKRHDAMLLLMYQQVDILQQVQAKAQAGRKIYEELDEFVEDKVREAKACIHAILQE